MRTLPLCLGAKPEVRLLFHIAIRCVERTVFEEASLY